MQLNICIKLMSILFVSITIQAQAENIDTDKDTQLDIDTSYASYVRMSTEELQIALETLSINGEHNLDMGLELLKRWTTES